MPKQEMLEILKRDREVRDILSWPFDFDLSVSARDADWFQVKPEADTNILACDGTGGIFLLYSPDQRLIHLTSEGQAGVIASDLEEGIRLMVAYPYWRDLLKFSGGGKLKEMRRVAPYLERELHGDQPDIDKQRSTLKKRLSLLEAVDAIASLHAAVSTLGKGIVVTAPDGTEFESLFNTFTVESNPAWKQA
ncbi:hypothetical protein [Armatimonas rosea]|uniref:SUKH-4 immunity protein n=1 Tax=Armatimonas rosea TaxID=685828 RepID=A0A7W9SUM8_ARMRO|nr:hypothetical protein [Armatimonas rosea]MBB6053152.1 hypothetical protein [Armatimonas rosea]